jgi:anaerobic ribonucleoside-triphosphate reductase
MAIFKVKKRSGSIVDFDRSKIEHALKLAIEAVGGKDFSKITDIAKAVIGAVEIRTKKSGDNIPDVETIQDCVQETLIKEGHDTVATAYIKYRDKRNQSRKEKNVIVEV